VSGKEYPAKHIFTLSIKALVDHFKEKIDMKKVGLELIENDIKWVLTVPAIWGDAAKKYMRQCAIEVSKIFISFDSYSCNVNFYMDSDSLRK
jgi:hypothetical protein